MLGVWLLHVVQYWSEELAALAQDWAERCVFSHRPGAQRKNIAGFAHSGENLYASTGRHELCPFHHLLHRQPVHLTRGINIDL